MSGLQETEKQKAVKKKYIKSKISNKGSHRPKLKRSDLFLFLHQLNVYSFISQARNELRKTK